MTATKIKQEVTAYDGSKLDLVRVSDVTLEPINWLWPGRIAKGKISLIAGHPGLGKSQVTISIAATVSTGGLWPVDNVPAEIGNVVFLSAEDDIADTLKPRLIASGADTERIEVIQSVRDRNRPRLFSFTADLEKLEQLKADLLIIDPITAYLGEVDSHNNADIRSVLAPLAELASRQKMAVLCVSHLNKSQNVEAVCRVSGSMAFVAAARAVYVVSPDKEDKSRRLLLPLKNNIGRDNSGLAFRIEPRILETGFETSVIEWEADPVESSLDDHFAQTPSEKRTALDDAKDFLEAVLANGSIPVKELEQEAQEQGYALTTIRRAKSELGIKPEKQGQNGPWIWQLPGPKVIKNAEDAQPNNMSTFQLDEHLPNKKESLVQQIDQLLCRHPKGLSDEDISESLHVPLSEVKTVRGCHG
ncbi:MAG: AAA family ATPase [Pseudomonadales bacterium]|nr:AAA family ATPase [Pseudomonadales bacterium]